MIHRLGKRFGPWLGALVVMLILAAPAAAQQIAVRNSDSAVLALGSNFTPPPTQTATTCTMDASLAASVATVAPGSGGIGVSGFNGATCSGSAVATPAPPTPTPTQTTSGLAAGAATGGSPPAPAFVVGAGSNNQRGAIQFGTGTSPAAGAMVVATFAGGGYSTPPAIVITPLNSATAALNLYVSALSGTSVTISAVNAPAASQASATYRFIYVVVP